MYSKMDFQNLCKNIRRLRSVHGLSRTAMSHKLGITIRTLDLLEAGICPQRCTIRLLYNIYINFGLSVMDCFCDCTNRLDGEFVAAFPKGECFADGQCSPVDSYLGIDAGDS